MTMTERDTKGEPLGTAELEAKAEMSLSASRLQWNSHLTVSYVKTTGKLTTPTVNVKLTAGCTKSCTAISPSPWFGSQSILPGGTLQGDVTYQVASPNKNDNIRANYEAYITQPGTLPTDPNASWGDPGNIRCDNEVSANPGCVYTVVKPLVVLPISQYHDAALTYLFQQKTQVEK
ncbi:hypothetical protein PV647_12895 [Streptomyces sp. ME02-6978.2a]|nr:hypothetical protein [Streptomyces sp. ME02-6978.2a]